MLRFNDVTVRLGGVLALDGVSAQFDPGVTGLIGPNGAGKTTALNALSGFVKLAGGSITADGTDLSQLRPSARARWGVRRMFQQEHVVQELTVLDNVRLVAENVGAAGDDAVAALEWAGLADDADRVAVGLSQLESRQLELARMMVGAPRVVLLDEPGAGLAERDAERLHPLIRDLASREGTVVVVVDHDMETVEAVCAQIVVLDFGRVVASGSTAATLANPDVRRVYLGEEDGQ